jgi:hypothetical protein
MSDDDDDFNFDADALNATGVRRSPRLARVNPAQQQQQQNDPAQESIARTLGDEYDQDQDVDPGEQDPPVVGNGNGDHDNAAANEPPPRQQQPQQQQQQDQRPVIDPRTGLALDPATLGALRYLIREQQMQERMAEQQAQQMQQNVQGAPPNQAQPPTQTQQQQQAPQQNPAPQVSPIHTHPQHPPKERRSDGISSTDVSDNITSTPVGPKQLTFKTFSSEDPVAEAERPKIQNLINAIINKGQAILFTNPRFLNQEYIKASAERPKKLLQIFEELFPNSAREFNQGTRAIISAYLGSCTDVFDAIANKQDRHDLFLLLRFLAISLVYGIDRALLSLNNRDSLIVFNTSSDAFSDTYNKILYDKKEILDKAPALIPAREQYYTYFRSDKFNPYRPDQHNRSNVLLRGLEKPFEPVTDQILSDNPGLVADLQRGNQKNPLNIGTRPKSVLKNPQQQQHRQNPGKDDQTTYNLSLGAQEQGKSAIATGFQPAQQQQQQPLRAPQSQNQQNPPPQKQQYNPQNLQYNPPSYSQDQLRQDRMEQRRYSREIGYGDAEENKGIRVTGSDVTYTKTPLAQNYPVDRPRSQNQICPPSNGSVYGGSRNQVNLTTTDTDDSDYYHQQNLSRMSNPSRRINFSRQDTIYFHTDDEFTDESFNPSSPDPQPVSPAHFNETENPFFNKPLAKEGKIQTGGKSYRYTPARLGVLDSAMANLTRQGYTSDQAGHILGTSIGVAQSISSLLDEKKRFNKTIVKHIPPPPKDQDFRLKSFDFRRDGTTPGEILGNRFRRTRFPSDSARQQVMKEIFQAVAMDPQSSVLANKIAIAQLAEIDVPKVTQREIQQCLATSLLGQQDDPEIVPPPVLGPNDLDSHTSKTLQTRISLDKGFSLETLTGGALKSFLNNLSSVITNAGLRESEAYALFRTVATGITREIVDMAEFEHKIPFTEFWVNFQKTQRRASSTRDYEKKLKQLLNETKVDNIEQALNEIIIYNGKIHAKETDTQVRKFLCQRDTLRDLRLYIRKHYSSFISQINTLYMNKLKHIALQKNDPTYPNENQYHPGKTHLFLEIACDVLSQVEPDDQLYKTTSQPSQRQNNTYIHATSASPTSEQPSKRSGQNYDNRAPTPGFQQQGNYNRGPPRNNYRQNNRGPQDQGRNQRPFSRQNDGRNTGFNGRMKRRPNFSCHLCNYPGHSYRECRTYEEQQQMDPSQNKNYCNRCGGKHQGPCKTRIKGQPPPQIEQQQQQNTMNVASINAVPPPEPPQPPQMQQQQQQQGFPQQRPYTPYNNGNNGGNYRNYTPGPYQQKNYQGGNYNPNYRPRSRYNNYRNNGDNNYRNYDRKPQYRNDGRRSGYGNRDYQNGNGYYKNYGGNRYYRNNQDQDTDYRQKRNYRNNVQNDGPSHQYDRSTSRNGRTYQQEIEGLTYTIRQHQQQEKQQGLGNDGFQQVHPSVLIAPVSSSQNDQQPHLSH